MSISRSIRPYSCARLDCYLRLLSRLYNATSNINAIIDTARTLGFMGFAFVANPVYGGFIAQPFLLLFQAS